MNLEDEYTLEWATEIAATMGIEPQGPEESADAFIDRVVSHLVHSKADA